MRVRLEYHRQGLEVELPDANVRAVLYSQPVEPLADPDAAIRAVLERPTASPPLAELAKGRKNACILICDVTRPVPNEQILTPMLETLHAAGLDREQILILVATGLHRPNWGDELREMVGACIVENYRFENHDGKRIEDHVYLGETDNKTPVYLDRRYVEADLKIATGLIEPHFMAGYSGGRKLICPGVAGIDTVRAWHSPRFLEHPNARSGVLDANPVHEENTRIAQMAGCDFIVNVCIDGFRRITHVCGGDMIQAWLQGVRHCQRQVTATLSEPVDVVVTSCAGYPLDATFYQSVKGMVGALPIVKEGGTVILAAGMSEGIGSPEFQQLLFETDCLDEFLRRISETDFFIMDQWQLEELAKAARRCEIKVVTDGLDVATLSQFFVTPCDSVEQAIRQALDKHGPDASIAVIPDGPYVMPELQPV